MSRIKSKDTKPEISLRKNLFANGMKGYRVNSKLPGKPDIIFTKHRIAIFVDGCFWHKCPKCFVQPNTHKKFWQKKIKGNILRDKRVNQLLTEGGYKVVRLWEHEIKHDFSKSYKVIKNAT